MACERVVLSTMRWRCWHCSQFDDYGLEENKLPPSWCVFIFHHSVRKSL